LRRVGILGGMGPAATVDLMAKVLRETPATRDEDHVPLIVWSVPQVPSRPAAIRGDGPSPLPALIEGARFLEAAGATALAIACNTAHHWAVELCRATSLPLLHIADAALAELERGEPVRTVALLGTRATLQLRIYTAPLEERGIALLVPEEALQQSLDRAIAAVKAGDHERARTAFVPVAQAMLDRGAEAILLGCTELPLIACPPEVAARVIDPTLALARAIVRHARAAPCGSPTADVS
jgi:aspartate racemase